mmetsp:Transcript_8882/g.8961  ORF Transcript_8882/g.8961 Transcript_8882/m.8961 type:complete len:211 (+) Transcript_8882:429-1061(+)|eukprot:CAMPEP_0182438260 /NCGR_PEP_ID=MMETSP1167-20130531/85634_1 /TAXON_ID=2988 /ORGANISM="Mallomonas Sp, Strain CCMP3275" /LENGTH=210 /DNA_ID=CAMNT_0024631531 /DNA_START=1959 /DNA_END=2591 /DNA_ORIENTATION=-
MTSTTNDSKTSLPIIRTTAPMGAVTPTSRERSFTSLPLTVSSVNDGATTTSASSDALATEVSKLCNYFKMQQEESKKQSKQIREELDVLRTGIRAMVGDRERQMTWVFPHTHDDADKLFCNIMGLPWFPPSVGPPTVFRSLIIQPYNGGTGGQYVATGSGPNAGNGNTHSGQNENHLVHNLIRYNHALRQQQHNQQMMSKLFSYALHQQQ